MNLRRQAAFVTALVIVLTAGIASQSSPVQQGRVDEIFKDYSRPGSPGCAVGVYQGERILLRRAYGMANLDHDVPLSPSSVFHVASVSKQFTAAAVHLLVQDGKLSLDDEVRTHVRELPDFGKRITIRHLLHHTSGIRDQWSLLGLAGWRYSRDLITDGDVLALLSRQKDLNFDPGARHLYSNSGYTLLAVIVSRVSSKSFREFTTQRIFAPLGMTNTHFRDSFNEIVKGQAYGYSRQGDTFQLSVTNFDTAGATSLLTTVEDLAKWHANFDKRAVGGDALAAAMLERGVLNNGERLGYASGLTHGVYRGLATVGHGGSDAGYRSALLRFPEQRMGIAVLCNLAQTNPTVLAQRVADVVLAEVLKPVTTTAATQAPYATKSPEVPIDADALARLAGLYWNGTEATTRRFVVEGGRLTVAGPGRAPLPLKSIGDGNFVMTEDPWWQLRFQGDSVQIGTAQSAGSVFVRSEPFSPTAEQLQDFAGLYRSDEMDAVYRMTIADGKLRLERLKVNVATLEPIVSDTFTSPAGVIRFTRDGQGHVNGFVLEAGRVQGMKFWKDTRTSTIRPS